MRMSLGVVTSQPVANSVELARAAESSGFRRVWVGEDITSREIFTYLSIIASKSKDIGIASGITSPYLRKITTIAASSAGVQHLSGGRFVLGLGPGGLSEVKKVTGRGPYKVVDVMRESTTTLRRIFNGERVSHRGVSICLKDYGIVHPDVKPLKIYFGVRGPDLLALAGEIADGIIFSGPLDYLAQSLKIVAKSAKKAERDPRDIGKALWNPFIMGKDLKPARPIVATMIASLPESALEHIDIDIETLEDIRRLFANSRYEDAHSLVKPEVIKKILIAGTKSEIELQIERCAEMGFDEFIVGPPYGKNPLKVIMDMGK